MVFEYIKELTETHFGQNFNELFAHLDEDGDGTVDAEELRHCMFGDFMGDGEPDSQGGDRLYDEITDMKEVVTRLEEYLVDYNGMSKSPMNLAMFLSTPPSTWRELRACSSNPARTCSRWASAAPGGSRCPGSPRSSWAWSRSRLPSQSRTPRWSGRRI